MQATAIVTMRRYGARGIATASRPSVRVSVRLGRQLSGHRQNPLCVFYTSFHCQNLRETDRDIAAFK